MIAKALEENGATVYLVGRRQEPLDKLAAEAVWMHSEWLLGPVFLHD